MSESVILITPDILKSVIYTMGAFIVVLLGFIWKIVLFGFNRFEKNVSKTIENCHKGLDDYAKDTRKDVEKLEKWQIHHIEAHHSK